MDFFFLKLRGLDRGDFKYEMVWVFLLFLKAPFFQPKSLSLRIAERAAYTNWPTVTSGKCRERTGVKE